jgi:hypothetical protein
MIDGGTLFTAGVVPQTNSMVHARKIAFLKMALEMDTVAVIFAAVLPIVLHSLFVDYCRQR